MKEVIEQWRLICLLSFHTSITSARNRCNDDGSDVGSLRYHFADEVCLFQPKSLLHVKSFQACQNHSRMSKLLKRAKITQAYQNHSSMPKTLVGARRVSAVFNDIFSLIRQWPHGRPKGRQGAKTPLDFEIWHFPINSLVQKNVFS